MKALLFALLALSVFKTPEAHAGNEVGNGGDVVTFTKGGKKIVQLLDYYEAVDKRKLQLDVGSPNESVEVLAKRLVDRLMEHSPRRAKIYQVAVQKFLALNNEESRLVNDRKFEDLGDTGGYDICDQCEIEQIVLANHRKAEDYFEGDIRYRVQKRLWDKLDNIHKAGLAVHEILYREALTYGITNSTNVRVLNGMLAANAFKGKTKDEFAEVMRKVGFPIEVEEIPFFFDEYQKNKLFSSTDSMPSLDIDKLRDISLPFKKTVGEFSGFPYKDDYEISYDRLKIGKIELDKSTVSFVAKMFLKSGSLHYIHVEFDDKITASTAIPFTFSLPNNPVVVGYQIRCLNVNGRTGLPMLFTTVLKEKVILNGVGKKKIVMSPENLPWQGYESNPSPLVGLSVTEKGEFDGSYLPSCTPNKYFNCALMFPYQLNEVTGLITVGLLVRNNFLEIELNGRMLKLGMSDRELKAYFTPDGVLEYVKNINIDFSQDPPVISYSGTDNSIHFKHVGGNRYEIIRN